MYNWKNYNDLSDKLAIRLDNYNLKHQFNKIEQSYYNHTRDIFCLSLIRLTNKKNICLDYGSNIASISNIKNKINFYIYHLGYGFETMPIASKWVLLKSHFHMEFYS